MPEAGPLGETVFEASTRATVAALLVKSPGGGCVESVVTPATQRLFGLVLVCLVISCRLKPFSWDHAKSFTVATRTVHQLPGPV